MTAAVGAAELHDRLRAVRRALSVYASVALDKSTATRPDTHDGLGKLTTSCGLTPFERDVLVLVAGCELDEGLADLCARGNRDPARRYATFGLALRALDDPHWDALSPSGPLRSLALIELDRRSGDLTAGRLTIEERVLLEVLGLETVDERLLELAEPEPPASTELPNGQAQVLTCAVQHWLLAGDRPIALRGSTVADRAGFMRALTSKLGAPRFWRVSADQLPADSADKLMLLRRLCRESLLTGSPIVLDLDDADPTQLRSARRFAHRLVGSGRRVVLSSSDPVGGLPATAAAIDLPDTSFADSVLLWRAALGPAAATLNGQVERLAGQFRLGADQVMAAASDVEDADSDPQRIIRELWSACRGRARADLEGLAQRIVPSAGFTDLVLPPRELSALRGLLRHARHRPIVYEQWQVTGSSRRGAGVTALFTGLSGTGKSLAAEVIAAELEVDLYRVDLSQVVSKYIGETEKNLRRIFDAAERSGAVLLIDEADAIFGQRSEVKDSHDRYANIEVSYLLQRMESYRGLAILTTNLRANIDDAFVRRLGFIITFPFPGAEERKALWERAFGTTVPVDGLDPIRLAQLNLAGGSIRNVALHAAFLAAERGGSVTMDDLLGGARSEYDKLDRPLTPTELAGWTQ